MKGAGHLPVLLGLSLALITATPARAHATQDFADEIKRQLDLPDKPSCLFCHRRNDRGISVDTEFSGSLKDRGFSRRLGLPSLRGALVRLADEHVDSDGDGVSDIDELTAGANPSDPTDGGMPPASCSVTKTQGNPLGALWMLGVACVAFLSRRDARPAERSAQSERARRENRRRTSRTSRISPRT